MTGRSREIAEALGGRAASIYYTRIRDRRLVALRYGLSTITTTLALIRSRPRAVIVTNPPVIPPLVAWAYCRLSGAPLLLDSHPVAFGRKDHRVSQFLMPVHRRLARRSAAVLVTVDELADEVRSWGGRAIVTHEAPGDWDLCPPRSPDARRTVLCVFTFAADDPVAEVFGAARLVPDVTFKVTGDPGRLAPELATDKPTNVEMVGYLDADAYRAAVYDSHLVMSLTTEPTSVMRSACEAVYAGRPVLVNDWEAHHDYFPYAVHRPNTAEGLADGVKWAFLHYPSLIEHAKLAATTQHDRWSAQLAQIAASTGVDPRPSTGAPE